MHVYSLRVVMKLGNFCRTKNVRRNENEPKREDYQKVVVYISRGRKIGQLKPF